MSVRTVPDGVFYTSVAATAPQLAINGVAESSTRVSALMRQVEASEWLSDPGVTRVQTTTSGPTRQASFVVTMKQVSQGGDDEEDAG